MMPPHQPRPTMAALIICVIDCRDRPSPVALYSCIDRLQCAAKDFAVVGEKILLLRVSCSRAGARCSKRASNPVNKDDQAQGYHGVGGNLVSAVSRLTGRCKRQSLQAAE